MLWYYYVIVLLLHINVILEVWYKNVYDSKLIK